MNPFPRSCAPLGVMPPPDESFRYGAGLASWRQPDGSSAWVALLAGLFLLLFSARSTARADSVPLGCTGSGLGINLFTSSPDVHIGDTLTYSVNVFNGLPGSVRVVCDATEITAGIVTPDGRTNLLTLVRTTLHHGEGDFYGDVISYVVRAEDLLPDGTVQATAFIDGNIQNNTDSSGARRLGVNTEVRQPCIQVTAVCLGGGVGGESGAITFTGTVRNCGNAPLDNVTVSNQVNGIAIRVFGPIALDIGQSATFSGSWTPANPLATGTAVFIATGTDNLTFPRTVSTRVHCTDPVNPLTAAPIITSVTLDGSVATVVWVATPGVTYRLQCKGNTADPIWIDIAGTVTASGDSASKTDVVGPTQHRFYRVLTVE